MKSSTTAESSQAFEMDDNHSVYSEKPNNIKMTTVILGNPEVKSAKGFNFPQI